MDTYVILRRGGRQSTADLQAAGERSAKVGDDEMSDDIRWLRPIADTVIVRRDPETQPAQAPANQSPSSHETDHEAVGLGFGA